MVTAELPGVPKENIKIDIEDDVLTISGEKKSEKEVKGEDGKVHRKERSFGSFSRSFSLPDNIDPKQVKANYDHGVLNLTIKKKEGTTNKVEVKIE